MRRLHYNPPDEPVRIRQDIVIGVEDTKLQNLLTKAINEASPEGILVVDDQGVVVYHNRRFLETWQIPFDFRQADSAVGMADEVLISSVHERLSDPDAFLARVRELHENPELDDHCEIPLRDGRTLERRSSVLRSGDGRHLGRVLFFLDITARKQIEDQLRISRFVSDNAPECIVWVDEQAHIVYANDAACREYGYTREELLEKTIVELDHDARMEGWPAHWQMLREKGSHTFETRHRRKDGSLFTIEVFTDFIRFDGRELIVGFFRNISERKQAEEKLLITQFVSDQAPESILWIDEQGRIVYANDAACRERGYTREELLAKSIPEINPELPLGVWAAHWQKSRRQGRLTFESRHRRKDGSVFPIEVSANFVRFGEREIVVAFVRDITERKAAEEQIRFLARIYAALSKTSQALIESRDEGALFAQI